jgi:hypothetical protein
MKSPRQRFFPLDESGDAVPQVAYYNSILAVKEKIHV